MKQFIQSEICELSNQNKPISINIEIGYGQISLTNIFINGNRINDELKDSIHDLVVGNSFELQYKELVCQTIVYDIQPDTNQTSYKFKLRGGQRVLSLPVVKYKTQNDGDVVFYITKILFI